jgi:hypothetical protein
MKTLKKNGTIVRVTDKEADDKIKFGWEFCPKHEWKTNVRDFGKTSKKSKNNQEETISED